MEAALAYSTKLNQLAYITKVTVGLVIIGIAVIITLAGHSFDLPSSFHWVFAVFSMGIFILIFPASYLIYLRMDELQKKLHDQASVAALTFLVSVSGIVGVLQANDIIPLFNQVWLLVASIVVWGTFLVFSDRFYK